MKMIAEKSTFLARCGLVAVGFGLVVACASAQVSDETAERMRIAAANMEDAIVVDCQLPGKLRKLGGTRTYLTPGRLLRTSAIVCRTRGGEYTLGDLASGTLSLQRWLVPAKKGDAEAQYYVARIHANGMDNVAINSDEVDTDFGLVGIGVSAVFSRCFQLYGVYDALIGLDNLTSNAFSVGIRGQI